MFNFEVFISMKSVRGITVQVRSLTEHTPWSRTGIFYEPAGIGIKARIIIGLEGYPANFL
jgi:hypothetical protein